MGRENSEWIIFGTGFAGKAAFSVLNGEVEFLLIMIKVSKIVKQRRQLFR